jgi:hypothetical protein
MLDTPSLDEPAIAPIAIKVLLTEVAMLLALWALGAWFG